MAKDWTRELAHVNFRCGECRQHWEGAPDLVEQDDDDEAMHHPFRYFADCAACGAKHQPQAAWERGLLKAHQRSTGPRTAEGKRATRANLEGHPTPEETLRTRFNAMKHGMNARVATYFPAKPGVYAQCQNCEVDREWCAEQPACVKQTELFMLTHAAFEQRDPRMLGRVHSDLHASLVATLQMAVQSLLADGVTIKTPRVHLDKDGLPVTLTYLDEKTEEMHTIYDLQAHPLFKPIAEMISRLGLSLSDLGMTVKTADDDEAELRGRLAGASQSSDTLNDFARRTAEALEKLGHVMKDARDASAKDPVLLEHQRATGEGDAVEPAGAAGS